MSIESIGNRPDLAIQHQKQPVVRGKSGIAQELKEAIQAKVETGDGGQVQQGEQRGEGVVGLLQEGHFKGVADIRLRINFYDQLQAAATQKSDEALAAGGESLVTAVDAKFGEFMDEFQLPDDAEALMTVFKEAADGLIGALQDGSSESPAVLDGLGAAFANLLTALQQYAPEPAAEDADSTMEAVADITDDAEGVEGTGAAAVASGEDTSDVAEEPTATEPTEFSLAVQGLQDWFEAEIDALEKSVGDLQILPALSEPSGNGVAYARFLEMYNALEGKSSSDEAAGTDTSGIETEA
jgi:hypothetical protein